MTEPNILILDDEEEWLYRHRGRLEDAGLNCCATQLSKEAIKIAKTNRNIKFALIDEILYVPPVPSNQRDRELQRWQGQGVIREISAQRSDIQIIVITSAPQLKSEEQGEDNQVFRQETAKLRRQKCVIDIIHKQDIKDDPNASYDWILELIQRSQSVSTSVKLAKPKILIGLGFTRDEYEAMAEQIDMRKQKFLPLSPFVKIGGSKILEEFLTRAKEKSVWLEIPGIRGIERLKAFKPSSKAFQILEFLALRSEKRQSIVICEQDYQYAPRDSRKGIDTSSGYDPVSVKDFAFEYTDDGKRRVRTGVQIEGSSKQNSRLKVAIHRLSQKLAEANVGAARQLFEHKLEHQGYQPNFDLGIVLYQVRSKKKQHP